MNGSICSTLERKEQWTSISRNGQEPPHYNGFLAPGRGDQIDTKVDRGGGMENGLDKPDLSPVRIQNFDYQYDTVNAKLVQCARQAYLIN